MNAQDNFTTSITTKVHCDTIIMQKMSVRNIDSLYLLG